MLGSTATKIFEASSHGATPMLFEAWIGALCYALELYFDFSGYTDMAIGISYIFNVKLPLNFNSPYKATNIIDFWRRWHMTLSAFLRDYLYIPLGGNRLGYFRRYLNLMITMLLGGLWHGAGWTFVIWGGLHGVYLVINHAFQGFRARVGWKEGRFGLFGRMVSTGITFISVVIAWVFFRSSDFSTAGRMLQGMAGLNGISLWDSPGHPFPVFDAFLNSHGIVFIGFTPITLFTAPTLRALAAGLIIVFAFPNTQEWMALSTKSRQAYKTNGYFIPRWQPKSAWVWPVIGSIMAISMLILMSGSPSEFLYFQF